MLTLSLQVEGVPDLAKAIFQLVLEVHHKEAAAGGVTENKVEILHVLLD